MSELPSKLPNGWCITKLGDVVSCVSDKVDPRSDDETPYLSLEHIESGTCRIKGTGRGGDAKSIKSTFQPGDVLFGKLRPYLNKVFSADFRGMCSTDILVLRGIGALEPRFLSFTLASSPFVAYAVANSSGINLPRTNFASLAQYEMALPPLAEQRRIVAKLEALQARSRKAKEALDAIPGLLEQFRQSVLAAAFRGDLTADWREQNPDVDPASVLLERIRAERRKKWEVAELAKFKAKGKVPKDDSWKSKYVEPDPVDTTDLPDLPAGWCWTTIENVASLITKGSSPGWQGFDYANEGIPFVRSQNVRWGGLDLSDMLFLPKEFNDTHRYSVIRSGDVLLNLVGASIGRTAVADARIDNANCNQAVGIIRLIDGGVSASFLQLFLLTPLAQSFIHGSKSDVARANFNLDDVRPTPIPIAPAAEQRVICELLLSMVQISHEQESKILAHLSLLTQLEQSIVTQAFRGELVPQDPHDEPASVLLERIRAERASGANGKPVRGKRNVGVKATKIN